MSCSKMGILEKAVSSFNSPFTVSELCSKMARTDPKTALTPREATNLLPHIPGIQIIGTTRILYALKMRSITLYAKE